MRERQREGIAKTQAEGRYRGRKPTARAKAGEAKTLLQSGMTPSAVARQLSISRASVYRIMDAA
jgi:DNA invertase Pin-like site-specific DNA recombinase